MFRPCLGCFGRLFGKVFLHLRTLIPTRALRSTLLKRQSSIAASSSGGVSPGGCGSSMPHPWWYNITRPGWRDGFATLHSSQYLAHAFLGYKAVSFETLSGQDIFCHDCNMIMRFPAWRAHKKGKKHKICKLRNRRIALAQQSCACTGCPWWIEKRLEDPDSEVATLAEHLPSALAASFEPLF